MNLVARHFEINLRRRAQRDPRGNWRIGRCGVVVKGVLMLFTVLPSLATASDPYVPSSDSEVLEVLPKSLLANRDELAKLRSRLSADPDNPELAVTIASRYLSMGNREGDPRFYGYARAAIEPWWSVGVPAPAILKLRAKLKEKDHLYDDALADLQLVVRQTPRDAQALIEVANIYRVQGKYAEANEVGDQLEAFAGDVPTALSRAPIMSATGKAEEAYSLLTQILPVAKEQFPSTVQWIETVRTEVAEGLGRDEEVEQHYLKGLADNPTDYHLLRGYGDFLLDHERADEALALLRDHINDNGVLLRAAIAARKTGETVLLTDWQQQLENRFEEIRLRGSDPHGRFEARFMLELKDNPQQALELAVGNWQRQKEVRDARNLLEAAIAAKNLSAAKPVLDFLLEHGTRHVVLDRLVQTLERD